MGEIESRNVNTLPVTNRSIYGDPGGGESHTYT